MLSNISCKSISLNSDIDLTTILGKIPLNITIDSSGVDFGTIFSSIPIGSIGTFRFVDSYGTQYTSLPVPIPGTIGALVRGLNGTDAFFTIGTLPKIVTVSPYTFTITSFSHYRFHHAEPILATMNNVSAEPHYTHIISGVTQVELSSDGLRGVSIESRGTYILPSFYYSITVSEDTTYYLSSVVIYKHDLPISDMLIDALNADFSSQAPWGKVSTQLTYFGQGHTIDLISLMYPGQIF